MNIHKFKKNSCCNIRIQSWHHIIVHGLSHQWRDDTLNHLFFLLRNMIHRFWLMTKHFNHWLSTTKICIHPLATKINKSSMNFFCCTSFFFVMINTSKMFYDDPKTNTKSWLAFFWRLFFVTNIKLKLFKLHQVIGCSEKMCLFMDAIPCC